MKKHLPAFIMLVSFFVMSKSFAQPVEFTFTAASATSSSSCDGELDIQCTTGVDLGNYSWYVSDTNTLVATGNHIGGVCISFNNSDYVYFRDNHCRQHIVGGLIGPPAMGPTFQLKAKLITVNPSTVTLVIQQVSGGIGNYSYTLTDEGGTEIASAHDQVSLSNIVINNISFLSPTSFNTLYVSDSIGNGINYYFYTLPDSCNLGINPLWASTQGYPTSDSVTCDGAAYVTAYGGTPPYTYLFSSGSTDSTASGLCTGSYFVTVTDADSNSFNTTFVIGYPGSIYISDPSSFNYIDTLYAEAAQNCGLDYSVPIDSFYIDSSYALSEWMYVASWMVWQNSSVYHFTETYYIDSIGSDYLFGLSIYCNTRSSSFGSCTLFAGVHTSLGITTGARELTKDPQVSIYPNPSEGIFTIRSFSAIKQLSVFNPLGQKVINKSLTTDNETVNISKYTNGVYYLIIELQDGSMTRQKLVKK
jgi:hypothetical protein